MIDLSEWNKEKEEFAIDESIELSDDYWKNTRIDSLGPVTVKGNIHLEEGRLLLKGTVSGTMTLLDDISLEPISYPFSLEIEEELEEKEISFQKELDIREILWQNIVLEVPLKLTKVEDFSKYQGDGWKLVHEDELQAKNNPFSELANMLGEE